MIQPDLKNPFEPPEHSTGCVSKQRAKRPFGVWMISAYLAVVVGLSMAFRASLVFGGFYSFSEIRMMPCSSAFLGFRISLGIAIAVAACFTWAGSNLMKHVVVALVVVHFSIIAYNTFQWGGFATGTFERIIGRVIGAVGIPGAIFWYFELSGLPDKFFSHSRS